MDKLKIVLCNAITTGIITSCTVILAVPQANWGISFAIAAGITGLLSAAQEFKNDIDDKLLKKVNKKLTKRRHKNILFLF